MTTTPATEVQAVEEAPIDQTVRVWLEWDRSAKAYAIASTTMDGHPLFGYDAVDSDIHRKYWTEAMKADAEAAEATPLPNAEELTLLLLGALPEDSPTKEALTTALAAAAKWRDELTEHITASEEARGDKESAAGHHEEATDITAAIALLSGTHQ
jgi:hypothetical protein